MSDRTITLGLAGINMALKSVDPELTIGLPEAWQNFTSDGSDPDLSITVRFDNLPQETNEKVLFDSGGIWQLYDGNVGYKLNFTAYGYGDLPYKTARFNKEFTTGEIKLHRPYFDAHEPINVLEYPLDQLIIMNLSTKYEMVVIHGCGIVDEAGNGILFAGQSGSGKSTISRIWSSKGIKVLSDERVVLKREKNQIRMYGTPWYGDAKLALAESAPLTRIYFLSHAEENETIEMDRSHAVAKLFSTSFPPFYSPSLLEQFLSLMDKIASIVPCHELKFYPDDRVIELIKGQSRSASPV